MLTFLVDAIAPLQVKALQEVAPSLGVTPLIRDIQNAEDLAAAFDAAVRERAGGLLTTAESIFLAQRGRVTELAARHVRASEITCFFAPAASTPSALDRRHQFFCP